MKFRKDDPLYYKQELNKLIAQAEENGLTVSAVAPYGIKPDSSIWVSFNSPTTGECTSVKVYDKNGYGRCD